jgi:HK97 family phage portal protein
LLLAGNSYLKKVSAGGRTAELWPVSPDRLVPIPSKQIDEWIKGYALDQKQRVEYEPDEIIHHKFFNPANPLLGIAPLEAAAKTVDIDNGQQDWNKAAMQNRGVVDGVMAFDRNFDTQDQVDKIAERLNESIAGPKNARKIKVVGSNAKYTRMGLTAVEMDFGESRKFNRDEIFIIFGIPPAYGGSQEASTYNNYIVSELIFWFQTAIPLLDDLKDTFNLSFRDELKDNEHISYDLSKVAAIKRAMIEWTKTATNLFEMGVPFEQLNKVFEFGFQEFEGWNKSNVKNASVAPVEKREKKKQKYTLIEKRATKDYEEKLAEVADGPVNDTILDLLEKQREDIFKDLTEANVTKVIKKSISAWSEAIEAIYIDVGVQFGSDLVVEKRTIEDDIAEAMAEYLEAEKVILTTLSQINETTTDKILLQMTEGIKEGLAMKDIQQAILDAGTFSPERALLIGRTEAGTAANLGQLISASVSGATHKTWSTATFEVRKSHKKMDNVKVKIDEKFTVGGEKARYPCDNNLSPKERCNCRCTLFYSIED